MRSALTFASLAAALTLVACQDSIDPSQHVDDSSPRFVISDGAHGGNPHFYFLPPLVSEPQFSGTFDSTPHPVVKVCALPACDNDLFTFVRGPGRGDIDVQGEAYRLDWHTRSSELVTGTTYRIRVYVGTQLLGYLDVRILEKQGRALPLPTDVIGLRQGHMLRLRFRIEEGAVHRPGSKIAFVSMRDGNQEVYVMNADGTDAVRIFSIVVACPSHLDWSPDGQWIAFDDCFGPSTITLISPDGSQFVQLNAGGNHSEHPSWSPDGSMIAFWSEQGFASGLSDIYVMRRDGTGLQRLTDDPAYDLDPSWSP